MKFSHFLKNYWKLFLAHICTYHPLEKDFIEKYDYELYWTEISRNQNIRWTQELLDYFEGWYNWDMLASNESISWNSDLIKRYGKRLDWHYLGRNVNLPISVEFINKNRKNLVLIETNKYLTEELKQAYGKPLLRYWEPRTTPITSLTEFQLSNLEDTILKEGKLFASKTFSNLYSEYILPNLSTKSLEEIFDEKFDFSQRYFKMEAIGKDIHGSTPEFRVKGYDVFADYQKVRGFFEIDDQIEVSTFSQQGPPRLYEMPNFYSMPIYPLILVSQNLKSILDLFKKAKHRFISVKLSPDKIKTDLQFYILQLEIDSLLKNANFNNLQFEKLTKENFFDPFKSEKLERGEVKDYESFKRNQKELKSKGIRYCEFVPVKYEVDTDLDIFTINRDIIVNEFVKNTIEEEFPGQVNFQSAYSFNIKIPQEKYDQKRKKIRNVEDLIIPISNVEISEEFTSYAKKAMRLEKEDVAFTVAIVEDEFYQKQLDLNVMFSEAFKTRYRNNQINSSEYDFLKIDKFFIQNEFSSRFPETYKSVIVAGNGCGDFLGLILEKDSDHMLGEELYEFTHDNEEVEKYR